MLHVIHNEGLFVNYDLGEGQLQLSDGVQRHRDTFYCSEDKTYLTDHISSDFVESKVVDSVGKVALVAASLCFYSILFDCFFTLFPNLLSDGDANREIVLCDVEEFVAYISLMYE